MVGSRLALVPVRWPDGGQENFFTTEVCALQAAGYDVEVIPLRPRRRDRLPAPSGIDVCRVGTFSWPAVRALAGRARHPLVLARALAPVRRGGLGVVARNAAVVAKACWLADHLEAAGTEHVHAYWGSTPATVALVASRLTGTPWSMTLHSYDIEHPNLLAEKGASASGVRVVSEHGLADAHARGLPPEVGLVSHLPVDVPDEVTAPDPGRTPVRLLCPAHQRTSKRVGDTIAALAVAVDAGHDAELWLAGMGTRSSRRRLRAVARDLGVEDRVRHLGYLPHDELLGLYRSGEIDIVLLLSAHEGLPISLVEAMAHGIPVVASAIPGVLEAVGGAGLLTQLGRPDLAGVAVGTLCADDQLRHDLGREARRRVDEVFAASSSVAQFAAFIDRDDRPTRTD